MIYELKADKRETFGKNLNQSRQDGLLPAVVYGPELEKSEPLFLKFNEFDKVFSEAGASALINLALEGEKEPREVLVKKVDYDPVKDTAIHVDFYQIKRGQTLDLEAELEFINESAAVKELGGVLVKNLDSVSIRCLPRDIISKIQVDLSKLETFEDRIAVKDLDIPETVEVMVDLDESVALVQPPRIEEEPVETEPVEGEEGEAPAESEEGESPAEGEAKDGGEKPAEGGENKEAGKDEKEKS